MVYGSNPPVIFKNPSESLFGKYDELPITFVSVGNETDPSFVKG